MALNTGKPTSVTSQRTVLPAGRYFFQSSFFLMTVPDQPPFQDGKYPTPISTGAPLACWAHAGGAPIKTARTIASRPETDRFIAPPQSLQDPESGSPAPRLQLREKPYLYS